MLPDGAAVVHRPLQSDEWRRIYRQTRGTRPPRGWTCARCADHFLVEVDGQAVSFMGVLERDVTVNGRPVVVGGLGYGATLPAYERQGCLRAVVTAALAWFADRHRPLVLLTCLDALEVFYGQKLGWRRVTCPVQIVQPETGAAVVPEAVRVFAWVHDARWWPVETLDLGGLPW